MNLTDIDPAWVRTSDGWRHAPRWKRFINTMLRAVQPQPRKLVVYTRVDDSGETEDTPPSVLGYGVGFVLHLPESR